MQLTILIAITLACVAWSLWIRSVTWSCRWEVAATLNIALQGTAMLLMSPRASETLGKLLPGLTGMWNLEDYIGHTAYIVGASTIVYNALGRLQDDSGIVACTICVLSAYVIPLQTWDGGTLVWIFACSCGAGYALAAAHSWRIKTKWFSKASH